MSLKLIPFSLAITLCSLLAVRALGQFVPFAIWGRAAIEISIDDVSEVEGNDLVFTVSLNRKASAPLSVDYMASNSTALAGTHYSATSGTLVIAPGDTSGTITVSSLDVLTVCQNDVAFNLELSNPTYGVIKNTFGIGTIQDDDLPVLSISSGADVVEGINAVATVSLSAACNNKTVSFDVSTANGTALSASDYVALVGAPASLAPGVTSLDISVNTLDDAIDEPAQNFDIVISNATNATLGSSTATQNILDNDDPPNIYLSGTSVTEGEIANLVVTLSALSEWSIAFNYDTVDDTAVAPGDFTSVTGGSGTILPNNLSTLIPITTIDDAVQCELRENLTTTLSAIANATVATPGDESASIEIVENDVPTVTVSVDSSAVFEGNTQNFTFTLGSACPVDLSFDYRTINGTAVAPSDYTDASGTLTIAANNTTQTAAVVTLDDSVSELTEDYLVVATKIHDNQGVPASLRVEILDNDASENFVQDIQAGYNATCALYDGSKSKCWGESVFGALGHTDGNLFGDTDDETGDNLPLIDLGSFNAVDVEGSGSAVCALTASGQVKCWGNNESNGNGQDLGNLGDNLGEMGNNLNIINLGSSRTAQKLTGGQRNFCALLDNAGVKCWGGNNHYQLGQPGVGSLGTSPSNMGDNLPYVDFGTGLTAKDISCGERRCCVITNLDQVKCWGSPPSTYGMGYQNNDKIGDTISDMGNNLTNLNLGTGRTVKSISVGLEHQCAILDNDRIKCWGRGTRLGYGDTNTRGHQDGTMGDNLPFVDLGNDGFGQPWTVKKVVAGRDHSCAILGNDRVKCWGSLGGLLGSEGGTPYGQSPTTIGDNIPFVDIGTSASAPIVVKDIKINAGSTCVRTADDLMKCWGKNASGEAGPLSFGTYVGDDPLEMGDNLPYFNLGSGRKLLSLGAKNFSEQETNCFVLDNNQVSCLGDFVGHLGSDGFTAIFNKGDEPDELESMDFINWGTGVLVKSVTNYYRQTCSVTTTGELRCYGLDQNGAFGGASSSEIMGRGLGSTPSELGDNLDPLQFGIGKGIRQVSYHDGWPGPDGCVILEDNETRCWGNPAHNVNNPINWGVGLHALKISGRCALLSNLRVKCFGVSADGQNGQGNTLTISDAEIANTPVIDFGIDMDVIDIASNHKTNCALFSNGKVKCWGDDWAGALGYPANDEIGNDPGEMQNIPDIDFGGTGLVKKIYGQDSVADGGKFCAIMSDDALKCWGYNTNGFLGYGDVFEHIGDSTGEIAAQSPIDLGTGFIPTKVSLGNSHACALSTDGRFKCWGDNQMGQLGLGDNVSRLSTAQLGDNLKETKVELCHGINGAVDDSFATNGFAQIDYGSVSNLNQYTSSIFARDSMGRIYLSGWASNGTYNDLVIARLDQQGNIDTSFGTSGFRVHDFGVGSNGKGIQIYNDEIYVGVNGSGGRRIAKMDLNGNLITGFGTSGVASNPNVTSGDGLYVSSNGILLQTGHVLTMTVPNAADMAATRFDSSSGSIVSGFGVSGYLMSSLAGDEFGYQTDFTADNSQMYITSERNPAGWHFSIKKYNTSDGSVVTSFGTNGELLVYVGEPALARKLVQDSAGNIYVSGKAVGSNTIYLIKANSSGVLDTSWNTTGIMSLTPSGSASGDIAGQEIVNGSLYFFFTTTISSQQQLGIAKINSNGTLDTSFGSSGYIYHPWPGGVNATSVSMVKDQLNRVILGFNLTSPSDGDWGLMRICLEPQ